MMMTRVATIACAALVALQAASAHAQFASCTVAGLTAVDAIHPQPGDKLAFEIALGSPSGSPFRGAPQFALARISGTAALQLDVVLAADAARFPGFVRLDVRESGSLRPIAQPAARGMFGPFAAGEHVVTTILYVVDDATGAVAQACDPKISSFVVYGDSGLAPVVEFYHAASDRYFVTQDADEIRALDRDVESGWRRTGYEFLAYRPGEGDARLQRIARYRGRSQSTSGSYAFVPALSSEALALTIGESAADWTLDLADAFEVHAADPQTGACPLATVPVVRLTNSGADARQRLVSEVALVDRMIASGWISRGVAWCAVAS
jgi:hypothetical protein